MPSGTSSHDTGHETSTTTQQTMEVHVPHLQGEILFGTSFVSQTVLTTWIFMFFLFALVWKVNSDVRHNRFTTIRLCFQKLLDFGDKALVSFLGDESFARKNLGIAGAFFLFIVLANVFGLLVEVFASLAPSLGHSLRPINSDLNTTFALALIAMVLSQIYHVQFKGFWHRIFELVFHASGPNIFAKIGNILFGWLHFVGEFSRLLSLTFRLFGNIFAGVVLIATMNQLAAVIFSAPLFLPVPFFLFETFVAVFQGFIFTLLMLIYFNEARQTHD